MAFSSVVQSILNFTLNSCRVRASHESLRSRQRGSAHLHEFLHEQIVEVAPAEVAIEGGADDLQRASRLDNGGKQARLSHLEFALIKLNCAGRASRLSKVEKHYLRRRCHVERGGGRNACCAQWLAWQSHRGIRSSWASRSCSRGEQKPRQGSEGAKA